MPTEITPRRTWYLLCLVPIILGCLVTVFTILRMSDRVESMQRVVVPGEADLVLDSGDYVAYGEGHSTVAGVTYVNPSFQVRCTLVGADGAQVALAAPGASVSYNFGGFQGESIFELTVPAQGTYHFACTGDGEPAVIAIGRGVGAGIAIAASGPAVGGIAAIVCFFVIRRKRKRAKAAAAAQPAAA